MKTGVVVDNGMTVKINVVSGLVSICVPEVLINTIQGPNWTYSMLGVNIVLSGNSIKKSL